MIGDAFASSGLLGGGVFVGGVTIARSFDLDPYFVGSPMLGYSGVALVPSTLEVWVNDHLVSRTQVAPGTFDVKNVPAETGSGNVRYVLRDAFGAETTLTSSYYLATSLLAKGIQDYSYSLGMRRRNVSTASFDYDEPVLLARHRVGVTDLVTVGGRLEAAGHLLSGGAQVALRTRIGELGAAASGSVDTSGAARWGGAGLVSYRYQSLRFSAGMHAAAMSNGYATLSTAAADDRATLDLGASASLPFGRRVSLSAEYDVGLMRDAGYSDRVSALLHLSLPRGVSLALTGSRGRAVDGTVTWEGSLALNWMMSDRLFGSAGWQQSGAHGNSSIEIDRPLPRGQGVGFRAIESAGTDGVASSGYLAYQGAHGRYAVSYDLQGGEEHTTVEIAGALVWVAGGGLHATRPVQSGFAVIEVPGFGGVRGLLNNHEVGVTDGRGILVVPELAAYEANRLSIAPEDLPLDVSLPVVERSVAPSLRAGVLTRFEARRQRFVRGRLRVRRGGRELVPGWGELSAAQGAGTVTSPIGLEGDFELEDLEPGRHAATVDWKDGRCELQLEVPPATGPVIDLGDLTCEVAAGGAR